MSQHAAATADVGRRHRTLRFRLPTRYVTQQSHVGGDRNGVDVNLFPTAKNTINEVVVNGYGSSENPTPTGLWK